MTLCNVTLNKPLEKHILQFRVRYAEALLGSVYIVNINSENPYEHTGFGDKIWENSLCNSDAGEI